MEGFSDSYCKTCWISYPEPDDTRISVCPYCFNRTLSLKTAWLPRPLFIDHRPDPIPAKKGSSICQQLGQEKVRLEARFKQGSKKKIVLVPVKGTEDCFPLVKGPGLSEQLLGQDLGTLSLESFVLVNRGIKILLVEKQSKEGNFWFLPGGLPCFGDDGLQDAVRRGIEFETGLRFEPERIYPLFLFEASLPGASHELVAIHRFSVGWLDVEQTSRAQWWDVVDLFLGIKNNLLKIRASLPCILDQWANCIMDQDVPNPADHFIKQWLETGPEKEVPTLAKLLCLKNRFSKGCYSRTCFQEVRSQYLELIK